MKAVLNRSEFVFELYQNLPMKCHAVEIGVLHGDFSEMLLKALNPKVLILVDPYEKGGDQYGKELNNLSTAYSDENDYLNLLKRFEKQIESGQVVVSRKYSYDAVDYISDGSLDLIYHDASHKYSDIKKDLNDWLPKLKDDGIMAGHDYVILDEFGVEQAVKEFIEEHGFEMILFNLDGGDWALKKAR